MITLKTKTRKSLHFQRFRAGDERIELPPKVLETPIIPFDQSPTKYIFIYSQNYIHVDIPWKSLLPAILGQALTRLVTVSSMCCHTSTSALSTSSSSRGFTSLRMGYLILRGASRLDAFSVYPFRTWLPGHGFGKPTGPPAVRPSRSSRTKDSSSQISYAHAG